MISKDTAIASIPNELCYTGLVAKVNLVTPLILWSPLFSAVDSMSGGTSWSSNPQSVRWISPLKNRPQQCWDGPNSLAAFLLRPQAVFKSALYRATLDLLLSYIEYNSNHPEDQSENV